MTSSQDSNIDKEIDDLYEVRQTLKPLGVADALKVLGIIQTLIVKAYRAGQINGVYLVGSSVVTNEFEARENTKNTLAKLKQEQRQS